MFSWSEHFKLLRFTKESKEHSVKQLNKLRNQSSPIDVEFINQIKKVRWGGRVRPNIKLI